MTKIALCILLAIVGVAMGYPSGFAPGYYPTYNTGLNNLYNQYPNQYNNPHYNNYPYAQQYPGYRQPTFNKASANAQASSSTGLLVDKAQLKPPPMQDRHLGCFKSV